MRQFLVFSLVALPYFSSADLVVDDASSPLAYTFNDATPENIDIFSPLSWEDMDFSIPSTDDPEVNLDLQEASMLSTQFFVADSNPYTLQSQCGKGNWVTSKLRARNGEQCKNQAPPIRLNPNVFDSVILFPDSDPQAGSMTSIPSEESKKCIPPYIYNLCCNDAPSGFHVAENFFKIWQIISGCYLSMISSVKLLIKNFNSLSKVLTCMPVLRYMMHAARSTT